MELLTLAGIVLLSIWVTTIIVFFIMLAKHMIEEMDQ